MIFAIVDNVEVELDLEDLGSHRRVSVFQNGKKLGHKDLPIRVDVAQGTMEYVVKSILRGQNESKENKTI